MTGLGLLLVLVGLVLFVVNRDKWVVNLLGVASGLPIGVVIVGGGQAVAAVYAVATGICLAQLWNFAISRSSAGRWDSPVVPVSGPRPGLSLMIFFAVWSTVVSLVAPTLFQGVPILSARGGLDQQVLDPEALDYTVSTFAQVVYTLVGVSLIWYLAKTKKAGPGFIGIGLGLVTVLCFWRLCSQYAGLPFPEGFFDNSPAVKFIDSTDTGEPRFRGIYSEPSSMGAGALTALVFFVTYSPQLRGWRRAGALLLAAMAAANGTLSSSATFVTSGLIQLGLACTVLLGAFLYRRVPLRPVVAAVVLVSLGVLVLFLPRMLAFVDALVSDKLTSSSYSSRSGADLFSLRLMLDTWGVGVGLGSNRPSSLVPSALSQVGVPGAIAFFGLFLTIIARALPRRELRPTAFAFSCTIITRLVSGPGLLEPFMAICLGVLASDLWFRRQDRAPSPPARRTPGLSPSRG